MLLYLYEVLQEAKFTEGSGLGLEDVAPGGGQRLDGA